MKNLSYNGQNKSRNNSSWEIATNAMKDDGRERTRYAQTHSKSLRWDSFYIRPRLPKMDTVHVCQRTTCPYPLPHWLSDSPSLVAISYLESRYRNSLGNSDACRGFRHILQDSPKKDNGDDSPHKWRPIPSFAYACNLPHCRKQDMFLPYKTIYDRSKQEMRHEKRMAHGNDSPKSENTKDVPCFDNIPLHLSKRDTVHVYHRYRRHYILVLHFVQATTMRPNSRWTTSSSFASILLTIDYSL